MLLQLNCPTQTDDKSKKRSYDPFEGILYRDMVNVIGGTYEQYDSNGTTHFTHTISSFSMGKYEVTYQLWYTVRQWALSHGYTFANAGKEGSNGGTGTAPTGAKYEPVTMVNWRDAIVWCNAYSEMSGFTPVYCTDASFTTYLKTSTNNLSINTTQGSEDNPYVNWSANGYRLPTEGEWQYAASNKGATLYNYASGATTFYNDTADTNPANGVVDGKDANDAVAVYGAYWNGSTWIDTGVTKTANVGTKRANALGFYDMSGNVCEWCWDWSGLYPGTSTDYRGPSTGPSRLGRGGNWYYEADFLRISYRDYLYSYNRFDYLGFRITRSY